MKTPALLFLAAVAAPPAGAQQLPAPPRASEIMTSGHGEVVLAPDHAVLRLGVDARARTAAAASSTAGSRVERVRQAIRSRGFPLDSVRVVQFDVTPNYQFEGERKLIDYQARATIQLTVRPLDRLGMVLDTALAVGAGEIQGIEFLSDSAKAARAGALSGALTQARADADALARAAGGSLGRLVLLSTSGSPTPFFRQHQGMAMAAERSALASAPPMSGEVVVAVDVQATWEFVPGAQ